MVKLSSSRASRGGPVLLVVAVVVGAALAVLAWRSLRQGPAPAITITTERAAIGAATKVTASFKEPDRGLGAVRLELVQGDKTIMLGERSLTRPRFGRAGITPEVTLEATVGRQAQEWLKEGSATLRASADVMHGALRRPAPVVVEKAMAVRLRPPRLEILSQQHYVRQGGSGMIRLRVGETAARSGVRAGAWESVSYPLPGGGPGERLTLYAIPFDLADPGQIKAFAEDDAGNRVELAFVDIFKRSPPPSGTIEVSDEFLAKVVPAIASQSPGFDASGSLLEQYLKINGGMRRAQLAQLIELARTSEEKFLFEGSFLQMPNTALKANFAEQRTYRYQGKDVDHQTHLGLDLASNAHAPVPAPNAGRVVLAGWFGIYGEAVILDHGYGLMSLCGHMSEVSVKPGDTVAKGQPIGASGSTGLAGGDHLHLEIFVQGRSVNPVEWLDAHWIRDNLGTKVPVPGVEAAAAEAPVAQPRAVAARRPHRGRRH